jgi:hypothetical protein
MGDTIEIIQNPGIVVEIAGPQGPQGPSSSSVLYESGVPDSVVNTLVGGAGPEPASVWKTRTVSQALDTILFPTVAPFISAQKSASLSVSGATGVQEVGSVATRTLTSTFSPGRITNGDGSLGPELVGAATSPIYSGPGITGSTGNNSLGSVAVLFGTNQWTATVPHNAGTGAYFDNKGAASTVLDGSRVAGSVSASTTAFSGVYPWYHLRSPVSFTPAQFAAAITALGNNSSGPASNIHPDATIARVIAAASGTLAVPYNVSGQFLGAAYESGNTTKTKYHVTSLDNGAITIVFNAVQTQSNVPQASSSPRWTRDFKMHISTNPLTNSNATLELRNS